MNGFVVTIVGAGAVGLFAAWSGMHDEGRSLIHLTSAAEMTPSAAPDHFRLAGASVAGECIIGKGRPLGAGRASIETSASCDFAYPDLARVARWSEASDGTVTLSDAGGMPVLEFAVSDGAGYETFRPGDPLLQLTALAP